MTTFAPVKMISAYDGLIYPGSKPRRNYCPLESGVSKVYDKPAYRWPQLPELLLSSPRIPASFRPNLEVYFKFQILNVPRNVSVLLPTRLLPRPLNDSSAGRLVPTVKCRLQVVCVIIRQNRGKKTVEKTGKFTAIAAVSSILFICRHSVENNRKDQ